MSHVGTVHLCTVLLTHLPPAVTMATPSISVLTQLTKLVVTFYNVHLWVSCLLSCPNQQPQSQWLQT